MKTLRWILALIFSLLTTACVFQKEPPAPEESCNFQQDAYLQRIHWYGQTMMIFADPSLSTRHVEALQTAMAVWNDIFKNTLGRKEIFVYGGVMAEPTGAQKDGRNVVSMPAEWTGKSVENAHTIVTAKGDAVIDADIELNGDKRFSESADEVKSNEIDLEALLIHELGHALGLKDLDNEEYTIMYGLLWPGVADRRAIGPMDVDALRCEY